MKEYSIECKKAFSDELKCFYGYGRLGDARRAAKEWVNRDVGRSVTIWEKVPLPDGHSFGAR